jgi:hypothetical protein
VLLRKYNRLERAEINMVPSKSRLGELRQQPEQWLVNNQYVGYNR